MGQHSVEVPGAGNEVHPELLRALAQAGVVAQPPEVGHGETPPGDEGVGSQPSNAPSLGLESRGSGAEAGILPHGPESPAVSGRVYPACVGEFARPLRFASRRVLRCLQSLGTVQLHPGALAALVECRSQCLLLPARLAAHSPSRSKRSM